MIRVEPGPPALVQVCTWTSGDCLLFNMPKVVLLLRGRAHGRLVTGESAFLAWRLVEGDSQHTWIDCGKKVFPRSLRSIHVQTGTALCSTGLFQICWAELGGWAFPSAVLFLPWMLHRKASWDQAQDSPWRWPSEVL